MKSIIFIMMFAISSLCYADMDAEAEVCSIKISGLRFFKKLNPQKIRVLLEQNGIDFDKVKFNKRYDLINIVSSENDDEYCEDVMVVIQKRVSRTAWIRHSRTGHAGPQKLTVSE